MSGGGWRHLHASVRGTSHEAAHEPCQDASFADSWSLANGEVLVAVVSDGAGSEPLSHHGAALVCQAFADLVFDRLALDPELAGLTTDSGRELALAVRCRLVEAAARMATHPGALACTFLGAVCGPGNALYVQLGDGAIVESTGEDCRPVFWPQSGEYVNTTCFLSDDQALERLQVAVSARGVDELALITDGLQSLALTWSNRGAHSPFFRPLFRSLRREPAGHAGRLHAPCVEWLRSAAVTARTDDDKTIVLATRHGDDADTVPDRGPDRSTAPRDG